MRVLAIDTALEACSVAVLDTERPGVVTHETRPMQRGHAESLIPMIARVLASARLGFPELDRIAVTTGPGSFTGLRVGISAARGIALAAAKPAVGLSTLAAYAAPFIMMAQNRQQDIDRKEAENDHQINIKAELEIELLHQKIDALREKEVMFLTRAVADLTEHLKGATIAPTP